LELPRILPDQLRHLSVISIRTLDFFHGVLQVVNPKYSGQLSFLPKNYLPRFFLVGYNTVS
jgi:hypothetical protein